MTTPMKSVMKLAHLLCKYGVLCFGGKHNEYLSESLKTAWAKFKGRSIEPYTDKVGEAVESLDILDRNRKAAAEIEEQQIAKEDAIYDDEDDEVEEIDQNKLSSCFSTFGLCLYFKPTEKQLDIAYDRLLNKYKGDADAVEELSGYYEYCLKHYA